MKKNISLIYREAIAGAARQRYKLTAQAKEANWRYQRSKPFAYALISDNVWRGHRFAA